LVVKCGIIGVVVNFQTIDEHSPHLEAVKRLGRAHSDTLGFLPAGAFDDYASERHIIVALNGSDCCGYVLYRVVRDRVIVAHFCVASEARKQGVARAMLNYLTNATKKHRGIFLSCRRDYEASKTWPRLGFHPVGEMPGRAADGSELVRWALDYGHPDLFSGVDELGALDAAIDSNVFVDLVDHRTEETEGLRAHWLKPLVSLCYTAELLTEFNRNADPATRKKRAAEIQQFKMLRCSHEAYRNAEQLLAPLFPTLDSDQDESDFRQLVRALAAEADAFVTRDSGILDRAEEIFKACGLSVVRPAELIGRIDTIEHEREYQRSFVAGTRQVQIQRISAVDDALIACVQVHGEQPRKLLAEMNRCLADPQRYQCHKMTGSDGATLAVYVVERDSEIDRLPILRVCAKWQAGTISR
jgi:ribosomal protein S18 acetylase RimI-like enzyme